MSATHILIQMLGAVALLLWGLYMVHTGIGRGFGDRLRLIVGQGMSSRPRALLAGIGVTMLLQSSTATALIVASFAGSGLLKAVPALAVMLGADIGTTLAAQIFSLDLSLLAPMLLLVGVVMHKTTQKVTYRQGARALIGLGLILLSLGIIVHGSEPMRDSPVVLELFAALAGEPLIAMLITALLTWLAHSSLAIVLLVMSFAGSGIVPMPLALAMVLGANLGGVIPPVLATLGQGAAARRVTFGNAAFKLVGAALLLPFLGLLPPLLAAIDGAPARQVVNFHTAFNLAVAGLCILVLPLVVRGLEKLLPDEQDGQSAEGSRFLDESAIETPIVGLSCAAREALRMGEYVEVMLSGFAQTLREGDPDKATQLMETDDIIDGLYEDIKLYITRISRQEVDEAESLRIAEILSFTTNLENIGDITENLLELSAKTARRQMRFSDEGLSEINDLHGRISANLNLAMAVFMSADVSAARRLIEQKRIIGALERQVTENHLERLREGRPESIETSAVHMDILRDLRRIHSHITAIAYPILDADGELRKTRLRKKSSAGKTVNGKLAAGGAA